jgi:hypothetical protein
MSDVVSVLRLIETPPMALTLDLFGVHPILLTRGSM